jgi:hypothetical protein
VTLNEVHRKELLPFVLADVVNGNDVRMLETGGGGGLGPKPLHHFLPAELAERQQLDGD